MTGGIGRTHTAATRGSPTRPDVSPQVSAPAAAAAAGPLPGGRQTCSHVAEVWHPAPVAPCDPTGSPLENRAVLTVTNLHKAFGGQVVLDRVNWFVPLGGRVAL